MDHSFNVEMAQEHGIAAAVIYKNINYWVVKNKKSGRNVFDGYAWMYNSVKRFGEVFPYLTEKQIRTALKRLEDAGLVKSGNYNKKAYDRTKWYTTEDGAVVSEPLPCGANGIAQEGGPIPVVNPCVRPFPSNHVGNRKETKEPAGSYKALAFTGDDFGGACDARSDGFRSAGDLLAEFMGGIA